MLKCKKLVMGVERCIYLLSRLQGFKAWSAFPLGFCEAW